MYIPQSAIVETGFDQSFRFVISSSNQPYKGYFHKDNKGKYWSEKDHNPQSVLLTDTILDSKDITADYIAKNNSISYGFTKHYDNTLNTVFYKNDFVIPTVSDYTAGYYTRYVAQLIIFKSPYVIELNKDNYDTLLKDKISLKSYKTSTLLWKLVGPINDIYNNNIRVESGIEDTNLRSIQQTQKTIKDISTLLTDPLQFSKR